MQANSKLSRVDDAYTRLKEEIRSNRLPPGFQAPEPELAARLAMSRTPLREALIRLQAEGLVELIPRHGVHVRPINPRDMAEIYEILTALEPEAAANFAATQPGAAALAPLEAATHDMETALQAGDLEAWAAADDRFHRALLAAHGNQRLSRIVSALLDQAHRVRVVTLRLRAPPHQSTQEHRAIQDALSAGDADSARRVFRAHRARAAQELLSVLDTYGLNHL